MGVLGQWFPKHAILTHVNQCLVPGRVLHLFCDFTTPPKEKYLVLACLDDECTPLLMLINSRLTAFVQRNPALLSCQVMLRAQDYSFLRHDSYLDCSQAVNCLTRQAIVQQLVDDVDRIKDELNGSTTADIVQAVSTSKTLTPAQIRRVVASLRTGT